jgi:F420-non-reducing hydrogenase large subunit
VASTRPAELPGGWLKRPSAEERAEIVAIALANVDFAEFTLRLFHQQVIGNPEYRAMIFGDDWIHRTYSMGTVDAENRLALYDGSIRVVDPEGRETLRYSPREYATHIAERVEPWTYMKFPYLRRIGWKGFVDGAESGVYVASPLARLNVAQGISTPRAQRELEAFEKAFGGRPIHHRLATHWARLIELLHAAERMAELGGARFDEIYVAPLGPPRAEGGIGSVEAPRGTLTHEYHADERGVLEKVNLLVGTTNNYAAMSMTLKRVAERLVRRGKVEGEDFLNRVEMGFRLYDPCLSCATHALPGTMPLLVRLRDRFGRVVDTVRRDP